MLLYTHGPPAEVVMANAFIAFCLLTSSKFCQSTVVAPAKANYVKHNCLASKDMVDQTLTTFRTVSSIHRVCSKSGNAGGSSRAEQCGVTIGGDELKNFRI